jgi:HPt (histidine-containing phosphotransfer) domain-containing protein
VNEYFDLTRIVELREALGSDVAAIVASVLGSMTGAIERAEAAVARGEFDQASQDAHRARNDALMLAAGQLQSALTELEAATRDGDEAAAEAALERVREVWSPTRDALAASVEA